MYRKYLFIFIALKKLTRDTVPLIAWKINWLLRRVYLNRWLAPTSSFRKCRVQYSTPGPSQDREERNRFVHSIQGRIIQFFVPVRHWCIKVKRALRSKKVYFEQFPWVLLEHYLPNWKNNQKHETAFSLIIRIFLPMSNELFIYIFAHNMYCSFPFLGRSMVPRSWGTVAFHNFLNTMNTWNGWPDYLPFP